MVHPFPPLPPSSFPFTVASYAFSSSSHLYRESLCVFSSCLLVALVALSTDGFNMALLCLPRTHVEVVHLCVCVCVCQAIVDAINPKPWGISQAEAARCATWLTTWLRGNFIALSASHSLSLLLSLSFLLCPFLSLPFTFGLASITISMDI